jgi:hypothetical protein
MIEHLTVQKERQGFLSKNPDIFRKQRYTYNLICTQNSQLPPKCLFLALFWKGVEEETEQDLKKPEIWINRGNFQPWIGPNIKMGFIQFYSPCLVRYMYHRFTGLQGLHRYIHHTLCNKDFSKTAPAPFCHDVYSMLAWALPKPD